MTKVILSVINDVATDNRIHKVCLTLMEMGLDVTVIGRKFKNSLPVNRDYKVKRMRLLFNKKAIFYIEYNIRLFIILLFSKLDILVANDLDTLLPNYIVSKLKRKKIVYDSHEYFTEVPELIGRKFVRSVWILIERIIFPKLKYIITVNDSIAKEYHKKYKKNLIVVRNISLSNTNSSIKSRKQLGLPDDKLIIIIQGAGLNINRGIEEMLLAMKYIKNAIFLILGYGDVLTKLKNMAKRNNLENSVMFIGKKKYNIMMQYTMNCDIGVSLDKDDNLNYKYSLPNKIFDYIQARIPVLTSNVIEVANIVRTYNVGMICNTHEPIDIADKINQMRKPEIIETYKKNMAHAANELCWENEKYKIINLYSKVIAD